MKMSLELNLLERSNFEVIIGRKPPRNAKYTKIYHDFNHYRTTVITRSINQFRYRVEVKSFNQTGRLFRKLKMTKFWTIFELKNWQYKNTMVIQMKRGGILIMDSEIRFL